MPDRPRTLLVLVLAATLAAGCTVAPADGASRGDDSSGDGGGSGGGADTQASTRPGPAPVAGANLTVHVIDVGQGDAILLETPGGRTLLMDAGHRWSADEVVAYLHATGVTRLDVFVASHGDADHIGGVGNDEENVFHTFPPARVYEPGYPKTTLTYETFLRTVDAVDAAYFDHRDFAPGDTLPLDDNVTITFLHPDVVDEDGDPNDEGIILHVAYGNFTMMLPGDAGSATEATVLQRDLPVASTVLKVGHHGSRGSTTSAWLDAVAPEVAVLSVGGNNPYGHPHEDVLTRLAARDVPVHRTDLVGNILITSDGFSWSVRTDGGG